MDAVRWPDDLAEVELPTVDELRKVAHTFRSDTGLGCDVAHPRHVIFLSDAALQRLLVLWDAMFQLGYAPGAIRVMREALLPKPDGGGAPLASFQAQCGP